MPLTVLEIKNSKPGKGRRKIADGGGLHIEISPKGTKTWKLYYRFNRKQKTITLGRWPYFSLAEARFWREGCRAKLARGLDPANYDFEGNEIRKSASPTFERLSSEWLEKQRGSFDPRYHRWVVNRFKHDIWPEVGDVDISDFGHDEVLRLIKRFEDRNAVEIGRKTLRYVSRIMQYAIASRLSAHNPVPDAMPAMRPKARVKHYAKLPAKEMMSFYERLNQSSADRVTKLAIRWTILTMVRTNETRFFVPSEIERLEQGRLIWRIPDERMKMNREHVVPLPTQAGLLLKDIDKLRSELGSVWMFPQIRNPAKPISENRMLYCLYDLGYKGIATMHGFRGMASTLLNEQVTPDGRRKFDRDWIELQLAHDCRDKVRKAYNSADYLAPRRRMMQWWADYLDDMEHVSQLL